MAEHLDNLLAIHHFLDIAVDTAQVLLLLSEVKSGFCSDLGGNEQHHANHQKSEECQRNVQKKHTCKRGNHADKRVDHLRNALADQLAKRIDIIRINRHDIAVRMRIKVFDRKRFHVMEQLDTQVPHGALPNIDHNAVVGICAENTNHINGTHTEQSRRQAGEVRRLRQQKRRNIIVIQTLHEQCSLKGGQRSADNAQHHDDKGQPVFFEHISQHTPHHAAEHLHINPSERHGSSSHRSRH